MLSAKVAKSHLFIKLDSFYTLKITNTSVYCVFCFVYCVLKRLKLLNPHFFHYITSFLSWMPVRLKHILLEIFIQTYPIVLFLIFPKPVVPELWVMSHYFWPRSNFYWASKIFQILYLTSGNKQSTSAHKLAILTYKAFKNWKKAVIIWTRTLHKNWSSLRNYTCLRNNISFIRLSTEPHILGTTAPNPKTKPN